MVGAAAHGRRRARLVHRLLDVGGLPERALLCRAVPVAVLLAVSLSVVPACVVRLRFARHPPAGDRPPVAGVPDPGRAGRLPPALLLLPQGLLPLLLAGAGRVRRARREDRLLGRDALSPDPPERSPPHVVRTCR